MKKVVIILILINSLAIFGQNVGIGTTNPQAKLHVNGNIFLNNTSEVKLGEGISGVDTNSGTIQLVPSSGSVPSSLKINGGGVNNEINIFAEGGTFIDGTLINTGKLIIGTPITTNLQHSISGTIKAGEFEMNNEENYMAQVNDDQFVENIATSNIVNLNTNTFNWQKFTASHTGTLRYVDLYFDSSVTYRPSSTLKICNGLCTFNNSNALFLQNVSIKGGVSVQRFKLGNVSVLAGTQYVIELSENNQWLSANSFSDANTDPSNFTSTNPGNKRLMKIYYGGYKNFKLGYDGNMHIGPPTGHNYKLNVNGLTYTKNLILTDIPDDQVMVANANGTITTEALKWNIDNTTAYNVDLGNVGINTPNPQYRLEVNDTIQSNDLRLAGGAFDGAVLMSSNDNGRLRWADRTRVSSTLWTVNGNNLYNNSNTNYAFNDNSYDNVSKLRIKSDDGTHNLRFRNNGRLQLLNTNDKEISFDKDLIFSTDSLTLYADLILKIGNSPDTSHNVYILNNNALGDNTLGVVSIGQITPQEKLTVNGRMNTKSIKLNNGSSMGKKQFGTATIGAGNTGSLIKSINLTFPTSFSSNPKVYATVKNSGALSDQFSLTTSNISSTGCTITVFRIDISSVGASDPGWGQNLLVDWIATK